MIAIKKNFKKELKIKKVTAKILMRFKKILLAYTVRLQKKNQKKKTKTPFWVCSPLSQTPL